MSTSLCLPSAAFKPKRHRPGNIGNWSAHLPFARDLIAALRPALLVELGTHYGESFFGFCQALSEGGIDCKAYAVDSWHGDEQAGFYDESVFEEVRQYNDANYGHFSYLIRSQFDEALPQFEDNSIDLLHIDGLHSFEAVSHDFRCWLPKVRPGGIVLLHDIASRQPDFGVWKLWSNLRHEGATFEFHHSWGLGIFEKPGALKDRNGFLEMLLAADEPLAEHLRRYYVLSATELEFSHHVLAPSPAPNDDAYLLQVFRPTPEGHSEEQSHIVRIERGDWQHVTVEMPSGFVDGSLRVDLANRPCIIEVRGVIISSSVDRQILWQAPPYLRNAAVTGTLARISNDEENGACRLLSYGFDPQLLLPTANSKLFDQPLELEIWLRISDSFEELLPLLDRARALPDANSTTTPAESASIEQVTSLLATLEQERESSQRALSESNLLAQKSAALASKLESEKDAACQQFLEATRQIETLQAEREQLLNEREQLQAEHQRLQGERDQLLNESDIKQTKVYLLSDSHEAMKNGQRQQAELEHRYEGLEENYQNLETSYRQLMADYQGLESAFNGVLNSHSWKLTTPLRRAVKILRPNGS